MIVPALLELASDDMNAPPLICEEEADADNNVEEVIVTTGLRMKSAWGNTLPTAPSIAATEEVDDIMLVDAELNT